MGEEERARGDDRRIAPRLPIGIAIGSIVIAIASMTFLILLLYQETRGPVEILREFARRVDRGDCAGSYDLLASGPRNQLDGDRWCAEVVPALDEGLDADFDFERAVLEGEIYEVEISRVEITSWQLVRHGERSWRVLGPEEGFPGAEDA